MNNCKMGSDIDYAKMYLIHSFKEQENFTYSGNSLFFLINWILNNAPFLVYNKWELFWWEMNY